jgi:hypothetical protein
MRTVFIALTVDIPDDVGTDLFTDYVTDARDTFCRVRKLRVLGETTPTPPTAKSPANAAQLILDELTDYFRIDEGDPGVMQAAAEAITKILNSKPKKQKEPIL